MGNGISCLDLISDVDLTEDECENKYSNIVSYEYGKKVIRCENIRNGIVREYLVDKKK